ncbi:MAG: sulfurtransferase [Pseudomonadota bacterium]
MALVEAGDLLSTNSGARVALLDGTWRLGDGTRTARENFLNAHIPDAVFFDIDEISDRSSPLPHMAPGADAFAEAVGALGVSESDRVVVYDQDGVTSSPRVWWLFKAMGHRRVEVLNGGLKAWINAGGEVAQGAAEIEPARYRKPGRPSRLAGAEDARRALADGLVIDARPADRFAGSAPEPRPGLRPGAMPGALNVPAANLVGADGRLKPAATLRAIFTDAGLSAKPVVTTCGSGVSAALVGLALDVIGHAAWALYDGSWAEWGGVDQDAGLFPVVQA